MTTKNYKLSKDKSDSFTIYRLFERDYRENLIYNGLNGLISNDICSFNFFDINNTSIICSTNDFFSIRKTPNGMRRYGNLRITGVEELINKTEEEIKSKGFQLKQLK